jgi:L-lactate utilization protein LutC
MNYEVIPSAEAVAKTVAGMKERNIEAIVVASKAEALKKIQELVPAGASVMNGSSTTLTEIGFVEYLKSGGHSWKNLHAGIVAEKDPAKQTALRHEAIFADYFLGSVHAITAQGELVTASASGSQIAPYAYTAKNIIWVASTNKIVPDLNAAFARIRDYVFPLEDARMKKAGAAGSLLAKMLVSEREPAAMGRKVVIILVNEKLGF